MSNSTKPVLIVGTGLHAQFAHDVSSLSSWANLLAEMNAPHDHEIPFIFHWESYIASRVASQARPFNDVELSELRVLINKIKNEEDKLELSQYPEREGWLQYQHIMSLNYDQTLVKIIHPEICTRSYFKHHKGARELLRLNHKYGSEPSIWFPHGLADSQRPNNLLLGTRSYVASLNSLVSAVNSYRARLNLWKREQSRDFKWTERLAEQWKSKVSTEPNSWVDLWLSQDLVFVGCSMSDAEWDLWYVLHERQRQFAKLPEQQRPKTEIITAVNDRVYAAGLTVNLLDSHDDVWRKVLL